jgi:miniconductance mechanosensitive channel
VRVLAIIYVAFVGLRAFTSFLNAINDIYLKYPISRERPITPYIQVIKIVAYVMLGVFLIGTLMDKSPWALITGLGAMSAIILLIFRDSILGFVAGMQLTFNDMVRRGDWIEMPKYGADGDVIDVTLNTVKVRNWDKTITMIPTYALVSDSFKNWRGMQESGGRRIKRPINIDMNSIKFCTEEMIERFSKIQYISEYIRNKKTELAEYNEVNKFDTSMLVNGRHMTNVGTFRAYIQAYLRNHPKIRQDMTFLIRQLKPTEHGLPIEIYVFSNDIVWANYESIQADIFDHILAVIQEFDLRVFQRPSGRDFNHLAQGLPD